MLLSALCPPIATGNHSGKKCLTPGLPPAHRAYAPVGSRPRAHGAHREKHFFIALSRGNEKGLPPQAGASFSAKDLKARGHAPSKT